MILCPIYEQVNRQFVLQVDSFSIDTNTITISDVVLA